MVKHITLQNGLRMIIVDRPSTSVVIMLTIGTGSIHEPDEKRGLSHFLEHMVFEGTQKYPTALSLSRCIDDLGGEFNAATSKTKTQFYARVPIAHARIGIEVIAQLALAPLLLEKSVEKERSVIMSEIDMMEDEPRSVAWMEFEKMLFGTHACGAPIAGTKQTVGAITVDDIRAHHAAIMVGSNCVLTIVGQVEDSLISYATECFTQMKSGTFDKLPEVPVYVQGAQQVLTKNLQQSYVVMGIGAPDICDIYSGAIDVACAILSKGQSGWLFEEFRNKRGISYDVRAHYDAQKIGSTMSIVIGTQPKHLPLAHQVIADLITRLQTVDEEEVRLAKQHLIGDYELSLEDPIELGYEMTVSLMDQTPPFIELIQTVSVEQVRAAAKLLDGRSTLLLK